MKLASDRTTVDALTAPEREEMFALMQRCYENMRRATFERDLATKRWALRIFDPTSGRIVGFSTQVLLDAEIEGLDVRALFSGDTVVEPTYWGDPALANAWGNFTLRLIDENESTRLYWFLTSKGFRTYRYLPLFFRHYTPGLDKQPSDIEAKVVRSLGSVISPDNFAPDRGVIEATDSKEYVRPSLASPLDRAKFDPHVRYFVTANPGYARGDELCCLAPLHRENFTRAAWRVISMQPALA